MAKPRLHPYVRFVIRPHQGEVGEGDYFLSSKPLAGYLNRMRRNLGSLDDGIESVRHVAKGEKPAEKRARLKMLRDLVELQNETLDRIKSHLLGRDPTGAIVEAENYFSGNQQVEYERYFKSQLSPWTEDDLKLKCEGCGSESEDVSFRTGDNLWVNLCEGCYAKREAENALLECEVCHVKNVDVQKRTPRGHWAGDYVSQGPSFNLCSVCWADKQSAH